MRLFSKTVNSWRYSCLCMSCKVLGSVCVIVCLEGLSKTIKTFNISGVTAETLTYKCLLYKYIKYDTHLLRNI